MLHIDRDSQPDCADLRCSDTSHPHTSINTMPSNQPAPCNLIQTAQTKHQAPS